jgi:hypothetical protein
VYVYFIVTEPIFPVNYFYSRTGEKRNAYWILVEKLDGKRPLVRPRSRWVDNVVTYVGKYFHGNE